MESDLVNSYLVDVENNVLHDEYVVNTDEQDEENSSDSTKNVPLREQDRFLPIANIVKIMKRAVPENGKIAKDARECVQECLSEFISFITSEASDRCQVEKRKTINGEDVLFALHTLGFDNYVSPLKAYLKKYRELVLSPVTMNKTSKTVVLFGEPYASGETAENEDESNAQSTVLLTYPKNMEYFTAQK